MALQRQWENGRDESTGSRVTHTACRQRSGRNQRGVWGMQHQSFLEYKRYRYLKMAVWLCLLLVLAYGWHRDRYFATPGGLGYGGSPMGYALGTIAALLVVWLMLLGARKRSYGASRTTLQG